jgi:hypothetical protein
MMMMIMRRRRRRMTMMRMLMIMIMTMIGSYDNSVSGLHAQRRILAGRVWNSLHTTT